MEFNEILESIRAEEAAINRAPKRTPEYARKLSEATDLVARVYAGKTPVYRLREAMTTSDFPFLFGDIIDRQLLANYQATTPHWSAIARRGTVPDFRMVKRFYVNGAEGQLAVVNEQAPYPAAAVTDGKYEYAVEKYGRVVPFSFEAMVNDDLDALKDMPARLAKAASRSEDRFATELYCGSTGPISPFYDASNTVPGNPVLNLQSLGDAVELLMSQVDADGEPIDVSAINLVVPPGLYVTAMNLKEMLVADINVRGGSNNSRVQTRNWLAAGLNIVANPFIPLVAGTNGKTSWWLFGSPSIGRPAMEIGFMRGYEGPQVFMKVPDQVRIGGGANVMDGSFINDSIEYKVRHIYGGTTMDKKSTVASNGSGVS